MSMNINIEARLTGTFIPDNAEIEITKFTKIKRFPCIKTRTKDTRNILKSEDKLATYKEIVKKYLQIERFPVFEDGDLFGEREPKWIEEYDAPKEHIKELDEFLTTYKGWEIVFYEE